MTAILCTGGAAYYEWWETNHGRAHTMLLAALVFAVLYVGDRLERR